MSTIPTEQINDLLFFLTRIRKTIKLWISVHVLWSGWRNVFFPKKRKY